MAIRAPVAGLSMASTTSSSLHNSNSTIGFCRFPTNRTSSFLVPTNGTYSSYSGHRKPPFLTATTPLVPSFNCSCSTSIITSSHRWSPLPPLNSKLRRRRCRAASPHPQSPPDPEPPSGDDQSSSSGSIASLSRFQESVQIFCAVFFWMSLFFWSSVWDGRNNGRSKKGPRFWK